MNPFLESWNIATMRGSQKSKVSFHLLSFLTLIFSLPLYVVSQGRNSSEELAKLRFFVNDECLKLTNYSQCKCVGGNNEFLFMCDSSIVHWQVNVEMGVLCLKTNVTPLKDILPKATLGSVEKISIVNCSVSSDETFKDIFDQIGVKQFEEFVFYSTEMTANKGQLDGLESILNLTYGLRSSNTLPSDLFEGVPNVKYLNFYTTQQYLPKGLFDPMSNLRKLQIVGENDSTVLADGIFENMKNLEYLDISNNNQLILSKDTFINAPSIKSLLLCNNKMETLPIGIFDKLTNLTSVNLVGNLFNHLPNGIFKTTSKLENFELILSDGRLRTLPENFLANLKSLTSVRLSAKMEILPENSFERSINIRVINLSRNKLRNLSINAFKDAINLEILDLYENLLTTLPDGIFLYMIHLKVLILSYNQLHTITDQIFGSLSSLETLWLDNNNLRFIGNNAFCYNSAMLDLQLHHNYLDTNSMRILFNCLHSSINLTKLNLANNKVTIVTFQDLLFLTRNVGISFWYNQVETVDFSNMNVYSNLNITLFLQYNPIKCDCKITQFVEYMQNKDIDFDLQCENPAKFNGKNLKQIDPCDLTCPRTEPEVCPERCQCVDRSCDNAFIINCSNTKLFQFPTLPQPNFIKAEKILLDMQNTNLKDLSVESSESYDKIVSLNLTDNNLENIRISHLPARLETLDLRRNNLSTLPYHIFDPWSNNPSKSKAIYLSQNPWRCNCDLLKFMQNINNKVVDADVLQCLNSSNQYQLLSSFKPSQLCPEERNQLIIAIVACVVGGLMFGLLIALCCLYRNEIKIWLYSHNTCLWFVSIEDLEKDKKYDGFVSYSHKDKEFVQQKLLPFLEHGPHPFKICDHERDWLVGDTIPQQIIESVENSRRTLIVLSDNYLDSVWGRMEFQTAHQLSLKEKHPKLIIILYEKITNIEKLDSELKAYLNMNTYLEWRNPWFWKKLLYAMPHSKYSETVKEFTNPKEDVSQIENEFEMHAI